MTIVDENGCSKCGRWYARHDIGVGLRYCCACACDQGLFDASHEECVEARLLAEALEPGHAFNDSDRLAYIFSRLEPREFYDREAIDAEIRDEAEKEVKARLDRIRRREMAPYARLAAFADVVL